MEREPKVKSLYKALTLLSYFDSRRPELGITELSELSGYLKSTTHNIMDTFACCGFVRKDPVSGKYRLGNKIMELSSVLYTTNDFRQIVRPYLEKLANRHNETTYLAVREGTEMQYLDAAYPQGSIHLSSVVGVKVPMYCTGIGKAVLAYAPQELVDNVIAQGFTAFTSETITEAPALLADLAQVRARGYAVDDMEHEYGIRCIGFPIRSKTDGVIGGISLSGPSARLTDEFFAGVAPFALKTIDELNGLLR